MIRLQIVKFEKNLTVLAEEKLGEVDRFIYLGGCISPGGRISVEVPSLMQKVHLLFIELKYV